MSGITMEQALYGLSRMMSTNGRPHTTETWHIHRAREAYARDRLNLTQLERSIEHILRGGYLNADLEPRSPLMDRVRTTRRQRNCPHDGELIDASDFNGPRYFCSICGADSAQWLDTIRQHRHTPASEDPQ